MKSFTVDNIAKGKATEIKTSIGTIRVSDTVLLQNADGTTRSAKVLEIGSNWIKVSYCFLRFNAASLYETTTGIYGARIAEVVK